MRVFRQPIPSPYEPQSGARPATGSHDRDVLVALNACRDLSRNAICRLALSLDAWSRGGESAGTRSLGVTSQQLRIARALLPRATDIARRELDTCEKKESWVVTALDPDYPAALRDLPLPPPVLYGRGRLPGAPAVAVVGSRNADPYGLEAAHLFSSALAASGLCVLSGFARGVDVAAHRGALESAHGQTLAVLGCGLGVRYPRQHWELGEDIVVRGGALLTEFPFGTPPRPDHFPVRNRIIAALALGTLVVQAAERSGALNTARHALELGREVWAVPGPIFEPRSQGTNTLIRDGALLVQEPRDILEGLSLETQDRLVGAEGPQPGPDLPDRPAPDSLLDLLPAGVTRTPEELAAEATTPVAEVLARLLELELGGWVQRHPGPRFSRQRSASP